MKIRDDNDSVIVFETTGREEYAFMAVIGIRDDMKVTGGWDDNLPGTVDEDGQILEFTDEERNELADYMIARWEKFREHGWPLPIEGEK